MYLGLQQVLSRYSISRGSFLRASSNTALPVCRARKGAAGKGVIMTGGLVLMYL